MTNPISPAAEKKAQEIAEAFMRIKFQEQAEALAWLVKHIGAALAEAEYLGKEAALLSMRRDR